MPREIKQIGPRGLAKSPGRCGLLGYLEIVVLEPEPWERTSRIFMLINHGERWSSWYVRGAAKRRDRKPSRSLQMRVSTHFTPRWALNLLDLCSGFLVAFPVTGL